MSDAPLYDEGFFEDLLSTETSARHVLDVVLEIVQPTSVVDVGCAVGVWSSVMAELHPCTVTGVDGGYVPEDLRRIDREHFLERDLAQPFTVPQRADLVICLEVAEHLPPERAPGFVADLTAIAPTILFSAAAPSQDGTHHINERWPSFWADLFEQHGYEVHDVVRPRIWDDAEIAFYYRQNILLFSTEPLAPTPAPGHPPLDIAHPAFIEELAVRASLPRQLTLKEVVRESPQALRRAIEHRWHRSRGST